MYPGWCGRRLGERRNCPRTLPLTLTGITKGPKNRGREREVEIERENRDDVEIHQIQIESEAPEQQQRRRSVSPILTLSPKVRQIHQEKVGSSEHQGSTAEFIDMLKIMKQEMQKRDKQLQIQLQLRDEYMDAELKRMDKNPEEALKQRDEEWKSIWETCDTPKPGCLVDNPSTYGILVDVG